MCVLVCVLVCVHVHACARACACAHTYMHTYTRNEYIMHTYTLTRTRARGHARHAGTRATRARARTHRCLEALLLTKKTRLPRLRSSASVSGTPGTASSPSHTTPVECVRDCGVSGVGVAWRCGGVVKRWRQGCVCHAREETDWFCAYAIAQGHRVGLGRKRWWCVRFDGSPAAARKQARAGGRAKVHACGRVGTAPSQSSSQVS